jgi:hypothetical protein
VNVGLRISILFGAAMSLWWEIYKFPTAATRRKLRKVFIPDKSLTRATRYTVVSISTCG